MNDLLPPRTNPLGRRTKAEGYLSLFFRHGPEGWPIPEKRDAQGRALWRFCWRLRTEQGDATKQIFARDWSDATRQAADARLAYLTAAPASSVDGSTVSELFDRYLTQKTRNGRTRAATLANYRSLIKKHVPALLDRPARSVTRDEINRLLFAGDRSRFASARTHNKVTSLLGSLFAFGVAMGTLDRSPVVNAIHRVAPKPIGDKARLSIKELEAVVTAALANEDDPTVGIAVLLASFGLRLRECTHVRVGDVIFEDDLVGVRVVTDVPCDCCPGGVWRTKTGRARFVPLPGYADVLRTRLAALRGIDRGRPDHYLLAEIEHRPRSRRADADRPDPDTLASAAKALIEGAIKRSLPDRERFHLLRAACRVRLSHAGVPAEVTDRVLGHTLPGVRASYDHMDERETYLIVRRCLNPDAPAPLALVKEAVSA